MSHVRAHIPRATDVISVARGSARGGRISTPRPIGVRRAGTEVDRYDTNTIWYRMYIKPPSSVMKGQHNTFLAIALQYTMIWAGFLVRSS